MFLWGNIHTDDVIDKNAINKITRWVGEWEPSIINIALLIGNSTPFIVLGAQHKHKYKSISL